MGWIDLATMNSRFYICVVAGLVVAVQCGYPQPSDSYVQPPQQYASKPSYATAPAAGNYAQKPSYPVAPSSYAKKPNYSAPPPPPANYQLDAPSSGYLPNAVSSSDSMTSFAAPPAPPAPTTDYGGSSPTYSGSAPSGIAGGTAMNYTSNFRQRARARAARYRARAARARTAPIRRVYNRRPLQPIRRFQKKAKH